MEKICLFWTEKTTVRAVYVHFLHPSQPFSTLLCVMFVLSHGLSRINVLFVRVLTCDLLIKAPMHRQWTKDQMKCLTKTPSYGWWRSFITVCHAVHGKELFSPQNMDSPHSSVTFRNPTGEHASIARSTIPKIECVLMRKIRKHSTSLDVLVHAYLAVMFHGTFQRLFVSALYSGL